MRCGEPNERPLGREPEDKNGSGGAIFDDGCRLLNEFLSDSEKMNLANKLRAKPSLVAPANKTKRSLLSGLFLLCGAVSRTSDRWGASRRIKMAPVELFLTTGAVCLMKRNGSRVEFSRQTEGKAESRRSRQHKKGRCKAAFFLLCGAVSRTSDRRSVHFSFDSALKICYADYVVSILLCLTN